MSWPCNPLPDMTPNCKVKILHPLEGVYPEYQPEVGKIYDAVWCNPRVKNTEFAIIDILDKKIVIRKEEFEVVEWLA